MLDMPVSVASLSLQSLTHDTWWSWQMAKHNEHSSIISTWRCGRVEDTDENRSTGESEADVLRDLKWLGLDWDEGELLHACA